MLLNRARAERLLEREGLEALVASRCENVFYLTGFQGPLYPFHAAARPIAIFAPGRTPERVLVAPVGARLVVAETSAWVDRIVTFGHSPTVVPAGAARLPGLGAAGAVLTAAGVDHHADPRTALILTLGRLGLGNRRLGVDDLDLSAELATAPELAPIPEPVPATELLRAIRAVKTAAEITRLEAALAVNERAIRSVFDALQPGSTWTELVREHRSTMIALGGRPHHCSGGIGLRSALASPLPGGPVEPGDVVFFDASGMLDGYWSDTGRSIVLGPPTDRQRHIYDALVAGLERVEQTAGPGVPSRVVADAFAAAADRSGLGHIATFWGHGLGLEPYEQPRIDRASATVLEEGMVFNFEAPYRELGVGGLHLEDTFCVTADGVRRLSTLSRELVRR